MTDTDQTFVISGEAACLLEDMGFTAVARKVDGVVTLEFWTSVGNQNRGLRRIIDERVIQETGESAQSLAEACAAAFQERLTDD